MQGDGHFALVGTLEIGHTLYSGVQRVHCFPFPEMHCNSMPQTGRTMFFVRPPGVERFVLEPDNVWYGRVKLLFSISVKSDLSEEVTKIDCAYISFCYDIKLEASGVYNM
jgi:hypothetical protein